ncbi:hypothetical protein RMATCC62417_02745 [Rhizopus microsporus]|nr:hypothetical protein RMATCC62417_02745 [Rhizopus microsporus]
MNKIHTDILKDTPFHYVCNVHKERLIPILRDHNISDQCKEIGKQILNNTKRPLSQHVDVLIPQRKRSEFEKLQIEQFKQFFGKKYQELQTKQQSSRHQDNNNKPATVTEKFTTTSITSSSAANKILELIKIEESYVHSLEELVSKIMKPLRDSIHHETPILDRYLFKRIFLNIEDILHVNSKFLDSLHEYQSGKSNESFGQICDRYMDTFEPYKTYFLSKQDAWKVHQQTRKNNRAYSNFVINTKSKENYRIPDLLALPVHHMPRYVLFFNELLSMLDPQDQEAYYLRSASEKARIINDMQYGTDSPLLPLYTLIKNAPTTFVGKRQLLGHFDATELFISSGKVNRAVTILVFSDKIVVVKRKSHSIQGDDYFRNIEENINTEKPVSQPFEFKGWADIRSIELFNGLKDRPETFFLRTYLPEQDPNTPENDADNYFRKSDRLYAMVSKDAPSTCIEKKKELLELCQRQYAIAKLTEKAELYCDHNNFTIPAFANIYNDEKTYKQAEYKNNILIIYIENEKIDLNSFVTDDVWIVILVRKEGNGYKQTIRSRVNLIPIRELSRELESEFIIKDDIRSHGKSLDFINTLWNNCFFYERRLRATEAYSCIHDGLLRQRARTRSRSRSLTRVASNMSIGRLFGARSRSSSPSRSSISTTERLSQDLILDQSTTHVPNPVLKVATVNKHGTPPATPVSPNGYYTASLDAVTPSRAPMAATPPRNNGLFTKEDSQFTDSFNGFSTSFEEGDALYGGQNQYQDNSFYRPSLYHGHNKSNSFDTMLFQPSSPESLSRPSSGTSHNSIFDDYAFNPADSASLLSSRKNSENSPLYNSVSSNSTSSVFSYMDEKINEYFASRDRYSLSTERLGDNSKAAGGYRRRQPLHPVFYNQPQASQGQYRDYPCVNMPQNVPDVAIENIHQLKNEVNSILDSMIQSQQQMRAQPNMGRYYNNTFESVKGLRSHIISKIDEFMNDLEHQNQQCLSFR